MSKWVECRIKDIASDKRNAVAMGPFGSRITKNNFVDQGVPVIRGVNLSQNRFFPKDFVFLTENKADELRTSNAFPNDLVFTHRGTLGQVGIIPSGLFPRYVVSQSQMKLTCDPEKAWPLFMYYYFVCVGNADLLTHTSGSGVPAIAQPSTTLRNLKIRIPPLDIQKKIAAVLSAYDDLIENNHKRIALLEKTAEAIYREWFVRLRFPGWQTIPFHKGIPEGWKSSKLGDIIYLVMGQSPKSEFYNEIGDGLPFHQGVGTYGERFPNKKIYCSVDGRVAHKGDILFSVRAPVGRLNIANCDLIIGRGLSAMRHKNQKNSYLFYLLRSQFSREDIIGNGAIFASVSKKDLTEFRILNPDKMLVDKFDLIASKIDLQIASLYQANQYLTKARDLLLARLISGKLPVDDLGIQFPPSMMPAEEPSDA